MKKLISIALLVSAWVITAQAQSVVSTAAALKQAASAPSGACYRGHVRINGSTVYICPQSGTATWTAITGGGGGGIGTGDSPTLTGAWTWNFSGTTNYLQVGTITTNSVDPAINIGRDITSGTGNSHAFSDSTNFARPVNGTAYNSFDARITIGGTANYDHYAAFQAAPVIGSSGTMANYFGLYDAPVVNTGTLTNRYGAYIANATGTGTVTTNYGVYIAAQTKGATNYAFYSAGTAASLLGGALTVTGQLNANATGGNFRLRADGTDLKDAAIFVNSSGVTYFSNWSGTRGIVVEADGTVKTLGTAGLAVGGATIGSNKFAVTGTANISGTLTLGNVNANLRFTADGTTAKDGGFYANSSGDIYLANWDASRGLIITAAGTLKSIGGDIAAVASSAHGVVLKSPGGTCYRITVSDVGVLTTASLTCP
jgi:hypothetical protein